MSEYQFVHFIAIDRPLTDNQLEFMRRQSTRATVSRREFTNEYHFGDFHGNAEEMMCRGLDLHLHYANYGTRRLLIRLPSGLPCSRQLFRHFANERTLEWLLTNVAAAVCSCSIQRGTPEHGMISTLMLLSC